MRLAIFDLDETLIAKDSDRLWSEFLVEQGLVDPQAHHARGQALYEAYLQGNYDPHHYIDHALKPVESLPLHEQAELQAHFVQTKVPPVIYEKAHALIEGHRAMGDFCLIITATLSFISRPISRLFPVHDHIGTDTHVADDGGLICQLSGTPSFQAGKVTRLMQWLEGKHYSLAGSHFYSDSINDLPLLEVVEHPIAVNPDKRLRETALTRGWPIFEMS